MTREQLIRLAETAQDGQEILDEMIHDWYAERASAVNNEGLEAQIDHLLLNGVRSEDIAEAIREPSNATN